MVRHMTRPRWGSRYFPHTRGDGPPGYTAGAVAPSFSPHAWGWSAASFVSRCFLVIFPTRVGMVRPPVWAWLTYKNFPHTRGDGPPHQRVDDDALTFSPHAWGWSSKCFVVSPSPGIFPTRVGMVLTIVERLAPSANFPHTRGDGPHSYSKIFADKAFSPHAWGWSWLKFRWRIERRIFPTRVGMVLMQSAMLAAQQDFPHTRGDGPSIGLRLGHCLKFSPHAWGWSCAQSSNPERLHIFPTRVGMVRGTKSPPATDVYFPHTRGDGPRAECLGAASIVFSPHAWGWSRVYTPTASGTTIFPTRVGMVL